MWAIVGSSGFERFDEFESIESLPRETPFGLCSDGLKKVKVQGIDALFLCRTGEKQHLLPSKINYRANIYALKKFGATAILALSSVRSLNKDYNPGDMVIPYQYIDRTKSSRDSTFCDNNLQGYVSLAHPICEKAAMLLYQNKDEFSFKIHKDKIYVCIEGPQFPTMSDAKLFQSMGGAVMGMTAFPEYALAREGGLHYLPCNFIVDYIKWGNSAPEVGSIIKVRHENYARALSVCEFVVTKLINYGSSFRVGDSLASSLNILPDMLSPDQKSWFDVIIGTPVNNKSIKSSNASNAFYKGNKKIPKKLEDFLTFINKYKSGTEELNIDSVRKNASALTCYSAPPVDIASIKDFSIKVNKRDIHLRLYHPNPKENLPILIYVHGGGFVSGTLDAFDGPCRGLSKRTHRVVVSIEYRLAPENPFPSGYNDVYDAIKWIYENAENLKASRDLLSIMGDSAGANYVALAVSSLSSEKMITISSQILLYPTVDLSHEYESMELFSQGYLIDANQVNWFRSQYLPNCKDFKDSRVSPLFFEHITNLPPTFIMTSGYDPLRDEGLAYAECLSSNGVSVSHYHFDNMTHAFLNFGKLVPDEINILYERVAAFLKK